MVPMCFCGQGLIRAASGTTFGVPGSRNLKENKRFYGFTDFRGKPARRGRGRHGPANQVTTGTGPHGVFCSSLRSAIRLLTAGDVLAGRLVGGELASIERILSRRARAYKIYSNISIFQMIINILILHVANIFINVVCEPSYISYFQIYIYISYILYKHISISYHI